MGGVNRESETYQECSRCLYSTHHYPAISFNESGVCSICEIYDALQARSVFKGAEGEQKLSALLSEIKQGGKGKDYDCIVGISGGVDSSYIAYMCLQWGLRPLYVHVDNGWNSELAVKNIENIVKRLNSHLYTHVLEWDEVRDYQLAFLKASVVDIDLPFDNAFMAILYDLAKKMGVKHIVSGHNTVTEGWMPDNFCHYKLDSVNMKAIDKAFGTVKKRTFPVIGPLKLWWRKKVNGIKMVTPLDYIEYNKSAVKSVLKEELDWVDYGGKHYENIFTKFYQGYILPTKFKVDKRVSHLSTLICSGQITREEAEQELKKPPYHPDEVETDKEFFVKKLGISMQEFEDCMRQKAVDHRHYGSYLNYIDFLRKVKKTFWS